MVCVSSAAITPGFGYNANRTGTIYPYLRRKDKSICPCIVFKLVEFDHVKTGIVQLLLKTEKCHGHLGTHPVPHNICRKVGILESGDIRKADVVLAVDFCDADDSIMDCQFRCVLHRVSLVKVNYHRFAALLDCLVGLELRA